MTVIMVNNQIYGMTGGQVAPILTPLKAKTKTSFYGNPEDPFDACELAKAAGATYVARWTAAHALSLSRSIAEAITHEGFAFIEIITQCPTQAGRIIYGTADPARLLDMLKAQTVSVKSAPKLDAEALQGKWLIGTLHHDKGKTEFSPKLFRDGWSLGRETGRLKTGPRYQKTIDGRRQAVRLPHEGQSFVIAWVTNDRP